MNVTVEYEAGQVQQRLSGFADELKPDIMKILEKNKHELVRDMKLLVPVDTGELRQEIKGFTYSDSMSVVVSAHDNSEEQRIKAAVVERGRQASSATGEMEGAWYMWDSHKANRRKFQNRMLRLVREKARDAMKFSGFGRK